MFGSSGLMAEGSMSARAGISRAPRTCSQCACICRTFAEDTDAISKLWAMMNRPQHRRLPGGASAEIGQGALIPAAPRDSART